MLYPRRLVAMVTRAALLACLVLAPVALAQLAWGTRPDGTAVTQLGAPGAKAVALFFVASDCPVSNRTFPEMQHLREEFTKAGVTFWYVYPNENEKAGEVMAHQGSFDPSGAPMLSPGPDLVRLTHAVATPEVSILRRDRDGWVPAYTGRIDNRYVRFGKERTQVTEHYAKRAIEAVLAGKTPAAPVGSPVGCAIMNPGARSR